MERMKEKRVGGVWLCNLDSKGGLVGDGKNGGEGDDYWFAIVFLEMRKEIN